MTASLVLRAILLFFAYFFLSEFGYLFVFHPEPSAHFWPTAGLTLAILLRVKHRHWPPYLLAIFLAEVGISFRHSIPLPVSIAWGIADTIEPLLAALIICRWTEFPFNLTRPKDLGVFILAAVLTPLAGAMIAASASRYWLNVPSYWETLRTWWFAISLGEIVVTPFILTWVRPPRLPNLNQAIEGAFLILIFIIVTQLAFGTVSLLPIYFLLPLLIWTLLRFQLHGVSAALLLVNALAAYHTARGKGPFALFIASPLDRLVALQSYLSFVTISSLTLNAFIEERRRSEARLQAIIKNTSTVIYVKDLQGRYDLVNPSFEKLFGLPQELVKGKTDREVLPKDTANQYMAHDAQVFELNRRCEFEEEAYSPEGKKLNFITVKFPLFDSYQNAIALCGISTDVTPLRTTADDLARSLSLVEATLESTADGILVVDSTRRIVRYNQKFLSLWKIPKSEMSQNHDLTALNKVKGLLKDGEGFIEKVETLYRNPNQISYDILEFKDGRFLERASIPQKMGNRIIGRVWSFRDVTEVQNAIRMRDDFISIASHELRTPLTPLKMQVSLLRRHLSKVAPELPHGDELIKIIQNSDREVERMIQLVENLLDVSRMSHGLMSLKPELCSLGAIVQSVANRYREEIVKSGCSLKLNLDEVEGFWDPIRLEQVVVNLLSNAVKYARGKPIEVTVKRNHLNALLIVKDEGIGISERDQTRIFARFERVVPITSYGGMGLGLFITRQIVEAHGGSVQVESTPGKGSQFTVILPIHEATLHASRRERSDLNSV